MFSWEIVIFGTYAHINFTFLYFYVYAPCVPNAHYFIQSLSLCDFIHYLFWATLTLVMSNITSWYVFLLLSSSLNVCLREQVYEIYVPKVHLSIWLILFRYSLTWIRLITICKGSRYLYFFNIIILSNQSLINGHLNWLVRCKINESWKSTSVSTYFA